ncbi:MAG TPA: hypothetical protein EYP30_06895 [Archaeoglobaceae archaeon]|nr:hypothetical protein [Archaeoglobaceae archaeon]
MKRILAVFLVTILILVNQAAAQEETCARCHDLGGMDYDTSLHKTLSGIDTGFKQAAGKDFGIDTPEYCFKCHIEDCSGCHSVHKEIPEISDCNKCHRIGLNYVGYVFEGQKAEHPDAHYEKGLDCLDCHDIDKIHGDGKKYTFADEAVETDCEDCHLKGKYVSGREATYDPNTDAHKLHPDLECSACHAGYYTTCYNCHFDTGSYEGYTTEDFHLMKYEGKYKPAYIQTIKLGDKESKGATVISPHTITSDARKCEECHDNQEKVFMAGYDGRIYGPPGVELANPPSKLSADLSFIGIDYRLDITLLGTLIILAVFAGLAIHVLKRRITLGRWVG